MAVMLAACGTTQETPEPEAPMWNRAGLEAQWRQEWYAARIPSALGFEPGVTAWREVELELPSTLVDPDVALAASAAGLFTELQLHQGWSAGLGEAHWEQVARLWIEGDEATGVLLRWGLKDDSVTGHDHRVFMERVSNGWIVTRIEERYHCARGVTEDGLCI